MRQQPGIGAAPPGVVTLAGRGHHDAHTPAHTQGGLPFEVPNVVVLRIRDGSIEARWSSRDLCMVFHDWAWALERLPVVCAFLNAPFALRIRA